MRFLFIFIFSLFFCSSAHAQVQITEVMYDLEGSDNGQEWIEIYNLGPEIVPIDDWYFFEAGVNHVLYPQFEGGLPSGTRAVVVPQVEAAVAAGLPYVIKSSFSLANSGEYLAIHNEDRVPVDSVTYEAVDSASGTGNSLQLVEGVWVAGVPTPGRSNAGVGVTDPDSILQTAINVPEDNQNQRDASREEEYYGIVVEIPEQVLSRDSIPISIYGTRTTNGRTRTTQRGYYRVNMGDGRQIVDQQALDYMHTYEYPGSYRVVADYFSSKLSADAGEDPRATSVQIIHVDSPSVAIQDIDVRSGVVLKNNHSYEINLSGWDIAIAGKSIYTFPDFSFIETGSVLTIPFATHRRTLSYTDSLALRNRQDITVSSFKKSTTRSAAPKVIYSAVDENLLHESEDVDQHATPSDVVPEGNHLEKYLQEYPNRQVAEFYEGVSAVDEPSADKGSNSFIIFAGLFSLALVCLRLVLRSKKDGHLDDVDGDSVEIDIEEVF